MSNTDYYKDEHGSVRRSTPKTSKKEKSRTKKVFKRKEIDKIYYASLNFAVLCGILKGKIPLEYKQSWHKKVEVG